MAESPFKVTTESGKVNLVIMNAKDGLPAAFALMGTLAEKKVAIRLAGGCKGMNDDDKREMIDFFSRAFTGYRGLLWSGGTRQIADGKVDPMVTDIPGIIASQNKGCIALGTIPRTDLLRLQEDSRLVLDEWGTAPNPDMAGILIVQNGADGTLEWDGDLDVYFNLMDYWKIYSRFTALGLVAWNGGLVTADEILRSINRGWPTILIKGSGRVTDEICDKIESKDPEFAGKITSKNASIFIVSKDAPGLLTGILDAKGFLKI
jgi:hypothetical protein